MKVYEESVIDWAIESLPGCTVDFKTAAGIITKVIIRKHGYKTLVFSRYGFTTDDGKKVYTLRRYEKTPACYQ